MVISSVDIYPIINSDVLLIVIQSVLNILSYIFDIAELLLNTCGLNSDMSPIVWNFLFIGLVFIVHVIFVLKVLWLDMFFSFADASTVLVDIVFGSLWLSMCVDVDRWEVNR